MVADCDGVVFWFCVRFGLLRGRNGGDGICRAGAKGGFVFILAPDVRDFLNARRKT